MMSEEPEFGKAYHWHTGYIIWIGHVKETIEVIHGDGEPYTVEPEDYAFLNGETEELLVDAWSIHPGPLEPI